MQNFVGKTKSIIKCYFWKKAYRVIQCIFLQLKYPYGGLDAQQQQQSLYSHYSGTK